MRKALLSISHTKKETTKEKDLFHCAGGARPASPPASFPDLRKDDYSPRPFVTSSKPYPSAKHPMRRPGRQGEDQRKKNATYRETKNRRKIESARAT
jgi:hypothetical protein